MLVLFSDRNPAFALVELYGWGVVDKGVQNRLLVPESCEVVGRCAE